MRPPRLCCGIKHTKSEILPPHAPQISSFYLLSLFSPGACPPLPGGCRAAKRPSGRERNQDAPQKGASIPAMRPIKSTQKGTFVWFGARGARKFKFSHFFGLLLRVRSGRPLHIYRPTGCSSTGASTFIFFNSLARYLLVLPSRRSAKPVFSLTPPSGEA